MRKPRDFDAELKVLGDKARDLKNRKAPSREVLSTTSTALPPLPSQPAPGQTP